MSLRFGFIRELSKGTNVSLPLVFDDIFVNFDNRRFEAACEAIAELVENNQILYFTCHPERAKLMNKCIENSKVIDMYQ